MVVCGAVEVHPLYLEAMGALEVEAEEARLIIPPGVRVLEGEDVC